MNIVIIALLVVGVLAATIGQIVVLIAAFRVHVGWGLAVLFVPFAYMAFLITHWEETKTGFQVQILGVVIGFGGVYLGSGSVLAGLSERLPIGVAEPAEPDGSGNEWDSDDSITNAAPAGEEAQSALIGLTEVQVRRAMGNPSSEFSSKGVTTWFYGDQQIAFENGIVIEAD